MNISSQLDALRIKDIEKIFYDKIDGDSIVIPKVTPFKGINTDAMYIKDNKLLFIKFMDTTEDIFFLLEEDLLEVMNEEYNLLKTNMEENFPNISYNYIFIMPNIDIINNYEFDDFIYNNIVDKETLNSIMKNRSSLDNYIKNENNEIDLNLFILNACPEYYTLNNHLHINKNFKKIYFYKEDYEYTATMLDEEQIQEIVSINYGNSLFIGGSGTSKSTIMLSKAIKLSRVYPHHSFLILTYSKQQANELREKLNLLSKDSTNIDIYTFNSFILKLAKKYDLIVDYNLLKKDYNKTLDNLIKQAKNIIKNKKMFKGIFIDEIESFSKEEINFVKDFLYKTKYVFNVFSCESLNVFNNFNIFKNNIEDIEFEYKKVLENNYRQANEIVNFSNKFCENVNNYIGEIRSNISKPLFIETNSIRNSHKSVDIIKVSDIDEQINSIVWEIKHLVETKGMKHSDICVVYPYNKKKLKTGKVIYFQYMLRKALEESNIPYIYAEESLTNMTYKTGVTISNIYNIRSLEYRACIVCQLEMLYNQKIMDTTQDYQVNDFVGDLNKVYLAISRPYDYLSIITTFNEENSNIIKFLMNSK